MCLFVEFFLTVVTQNGAVLYILAGLSLMYRYEKKKNTSILFSRLKRSWLMTHSNHNEGIQKTLPGRSKCSVETYLLCANHVAIPVLRLYSTVLLSECIYSVVYSHRSALGA